MKINIKDYVAREQEGIRKEVRNFFSPPSLLILQHGDDPASNSYIKGKMKDAGKCGISATLIKSNSAKEILDFAVRNREYFDGIILQEPHNLPLTYVDQIFGNMEDYQDVDGMGAMSVHTPCAPKGIMEIIAEFYPKEDIAGEVVVVVGKGKLVGKPLVPLLMEKGCTVISCNSKTENLSKYTRMADIVVSAVGKENLITRDMLKDGAFVIDAGITFDENGKLCGDCDKAIYDDEQIAITTVPGGVGLTTRLALMKNTFEAKSKMARLHA